MKKLKLEKGDHVTLVKHTHNKSIVTIFTVTPLKNTNRNNDNFIIIGSKLHTYLEHLGISPSKSHKQTTLRIFPRHSQRKYYSTIDLLEIQKAQIWYISILNKLLFWKKKKK